MTSTRPGPGPRTSRGPRATGAALLRVPGHTSAAMGQVSIQQMLIQQRVPRKTEAEALISLIDVNSYFDLRIGYWQQLLFIT